MRFIKGSMIALGFVGAFVVGVWTSPYVRPELRSANETQTTMQAPSMSAMPEAPAAPVTRPVAKAAPRAEVRAIPASSDEVLRRAKPLLNRGTDMKMASSGFRDAQTFVTTAHVARNTQIPFVVLKHRILEEGRTLTSAVREEKPELNAAQEVNRAAAAARADLAAIGN